MKLQIFYFKILLDNKYPRFWEDRTLSSYLFFLSIEQIVKKFVLREILNWINIFNTYFESKIQSLYYKKGTVYYKKGYRVS